jgi:hypothetical protein
MRRTRGSRKKSASDTLSGGTPTVAMAPARDYMPRRGDPKEAVRLRGSPWHSLLRSAKNELSLLLFRVSPTIFLYFLRIFPITSVSIQVN